MSPGGFLPVAPRPFEDELLSSWQGRIACRYDLCADDLSQRLEVAPHDRPIGFWGRDFAPGSAVVSAWARACRVSEERVRDMALSTRRRPVGLYVWGEGGAVGAMRRPVCPACLDEDADAGLDHHIRRTWALVESCLCDRHGRFLSETCAHCPSLLGFRFRNRGGARLVCIQCQIAVRDLAAASDAASSGIQGFFRMLSSVFSESNDSFPSTASAALRAARLLWAPPRARGRSRQDPLCSARRLRRSLSATDWSGPGLERALGDGLPGVADGDAPWRRATPRSRRRHAELGFRAVHARPTGGMDGRRPPGVSRPFGSRCRGRTRSSSGSAAARPRGVPEARRHHFGQRGVAKFARRPSRRAAANARSAHEPRARLGARAAGPSETRRLGLTRSTPSRRSKSRDLGFGGPAIQGLESIDLAAKSTGKSTVGEPQFIGLLCIEIQAFLYCTISGLSHNFPDWRRV